MFFHFRGTFKCGVLLIEYGSLFWGGDCCCLYLIVSILTVACFLYLYRLGRATTTETEAKHRQTTKEHEAKLSVT